MVGGTASIENATVRLDGRAKTITLEKEKVITVDDGSCAWTAPIVPPVASPTTAAGFAVVGGFEPPPFAV